MTEVPSRRDQDVNLPHSLYSSPSPCSFRRCPCINNIWTELGWQSFPSLKLEMSHSQVIGETHTGDAQARDLGVCVWGRRKSRLVVVVVAVVVWPPSPHEVYPPFFNRQLTSGKWIGVLILCSYLDTRFCKRLAHVYAFVKALQFSTLSQNFSISKPLWSD